MSVLPVYTYGQPVLRKKAKPVREVGDGLVKFVQDMFDTMHNAHGIGLAANQVGLLQRVIVIDVSEMGEEHTDAKPLVMLNPQIVRQEGEWRMEEGCLSIPDIRDDVTRAESIRVRYKDLNFNDQEMDASDLLAWVILHEIDHLDGVLFIDHLGAVKRKLMTGRLNKIRKGEVDIAYPIVIEGTETPVSRG